MRPLRRHRQAATLLAAPAFALTFGGLAATPAHAATTDVACSPAALIQAITTANSTPTTSDTLNLARDCTYGYAEQVAGPGRSALPQITSPIVINGRDATIARDDDTGNEFRFFNLPPTTGGNLTLRDVTLTNAEIGGGGQGGAIQLGFGTVVSLSNTRLTGNTSSNGGGAIHNSNGTLRVEGSYFKGNNTEAGHGGAILSSGATRVDLSVFTNNSTGSVSGGNGGAISHTSISAPFALTSSILTGNEAKGLGGALYNNSSSATVSDSQIRSNDARTGGGIANFGGLTINMLTTIRGNTGAFSGGGIYNFGTLNTRNTVIDRNAATQGTGGGLHNQGDATLTDSRVTRNTAAHAPGGVHNEGGSITLNHTTIENSNPGNCDPANPAVTGCTQ
ncbi:hypothetical protein [Streptomyces sp. NBC_01264]|uniref:hypothetical protein n=1 Tax=Streptomyces sp. NBC_01264 TaxID=2903804 RepID=UPI0022503DD3|nr:hypothetical protein [Streptomyces sp. NBC_01264]MCX4776039.1 hypothetical protein [Streptomyces sp. NBC_01264]